MLTFSVGDQVQETEQLETLVTGQLVPKVLVVLAAKKGFLSIILPLSVN